MQDPVRDQGIFVRIAAWLKHQNRLRWTDSFSYLLVRAAAGVVVAVHGLPDWLGGYGSFGLLGLSLLSTEPSGFMSVLLIYLELIGGLAVTLGLFTRPFAFALAAEFVWLTAIIIRTNGRMPNVGDFAGLAGVLIGIGLAGGGRYALDRKIESWSYKSPT